MGCSTSSIYSGDSVSGLLLSVYTMCEKEATETSTHHLYPNCGGNLHYFFYVSININDRD